MRYGNPAMHWWRQHAFWVAFGVCCAWVGATGCKGSEHVVLAPIVRDVDNLSGGSGGGGAGGSSPMDGGNSHPGEAGAPDADASDAEIDSGLDPNVTFDWIQTLPGQGMCGPGTFAGSFSCSNEGRPAPPIVGQLTIVVEPSGETESTLLVSGKLTDAFGFDVFSGTIAGTLDCTQNELDAITTDGKVNDLLMSTFDTTMKGNYDPETLEIIGEIVITSHSDPPDVCRGAFQVGSSL